MSAISFRNVFVMGAPYSGSTLLGRLLDSHSRIACGGELGLLGQAIANRRPCSCGRLVTECPFWQRLLSSLPGRTHPDYHPAESAAGSALRTNPACCGLRSTSTTSPIPARRRTPAPGPARSGSTSAGAKSSSRPCLRKSSGARGLGWSFTSFPRREQDPTCAAEGPAAARGLVHRPERRRQIHARKRPG